ncbi:hypothetical protein RhiirA4_486461 [Rhizophagus irregularis]|uniref:Uncharacterized protein n=1 Tax=Rhizophagus irregularis TaxID=588596 RepID=A0A2I1HRE1_9GLOM|nr:hypothetical protein RhiirA4_486461 [Rhizophagus irregularis]
MRGNSVSFFLFLDSLLVSFDMAFQIFDTFLFIKIIDDGLGIRQLLFLQVFVRADYGGSSLFRHDISSASSKLL